jgi:hypothetical protein
MNFTIKSRKTGEIFSFYAPESGGYVHLESQGHSGNSGAQICRGEGLWAVRCTVTLLRTILPVLPVNGTDSS